MPDKHSLEQRSYNMSRIRSAGTTPERRLGELLIAMFPSEEIVERPSCLYGKPDWWIPSLRMAFFADGCFFHKCPRHFIAPENNRCYWQKKITRNRIRDKEVDKKLLQDGVMPVRIWEHNLKKDLTLARRKIRRYQHKTL